MEEGREEAELRRQFDVREERFTHGGFDVEMILPRAADALIDEADFDADERLPYWADLWPSARALARHLLDGPAPAGPVLELGSGVALPSLALLWRGVDVLATDWYPDALRFARACAARNRLGTLRTEPLDWRHPPRDAAYPTVIAADVLYEVRNVRVLAVLLPRVVAPGGEVLLADPGRVHAREFRAAMAGAGWSVATAATYDEESAPGARSRVSVLRLRPPGA